MWIFPNLKPGAFHEEEVTERRVDYETATGKPYASSKSDCQGGPKAERTEWSHNLHVSQSPSTHTGSSILDRQEDPRTTT